MVSIVTKQRIRVLLSKQSTRQGFFQLVKAVLNENMDARCSHIDFDFRQVEALGIRAIAVLSNLVELLRKAEVVVTFSNYEACRALEFLHRTGFHSRYLAQAASNRTATTRHMLPLVLVDYAGSHSYIENRIVPWLEAAVDADEGQLASINVCLKEIFNNIVDHSTVDVGCSIACFDENKGRIEICASDFGIGIPRNVRAKMPHLDDREAVERACEEGFTTKSTPRNRGAGLHILMQNVVELNKGQVVLYSGHGSIRRSRLTGEMEHVSVRTPSAYPGTLVYMTLDAASVHREETQEEFEW